MVETKKEKERKLAIAKENKKKEAQLKKAAKKKALEAELQFLPIQVPEGKKYLGEYSKDPGIKNLVRYFNIVEKDKHRMLFDEEHNIVTVKKCHGYGIVFNNGVEIRHIEAKFFAYFKAEGNDVVDKRERAFVPIKN